MKKEFNSLTISEIRKVNRAAQKRDKTDSQITGYGYTNTGADELGFLTIRCEICSQNMTKREDDIILNVFLPDRRRSFVTV